MNCGRCPVPIRKHRGSFVDVMMEMIVIIDHSFVIISILTVMIDAEFQENGQNL